MNIYFTERFPKGHPCAGEPTNFAEKILAGEKVHTIRCPTNIEQLEKTLQKCEVKLISGSWRKPGTVIKEFPVGYIITQRIIKVEILGDIWFSFIFNEKWFSIDIDQIAENDGLSSADLKAWFADVPLGQEMLLIRFDNKHYF